MAQTMRDLQSVVDHGATQGAVGVVGYCFGGLLTYLSACQPAALQLRLVITVAALSVLDHKPKCPLIMHFGELDAHIPMTDVEKIKQQIRAFQCTSTMPIMDSTATIEPAQ